MRVYVDATGRPVPCTLSVVRSTHPRLAQALQQAVLHARYAPATKGSTPVGTWLQQPVRVD